MRRLDCWTVLSVLLIVFQFFVASANSSVIENARFTDIVPEEIEEEYKNVKDPKCKLFC